MSWIKGKIGHYIYHHCSKCGYSPNQTNLNAKLPKTCPLCGAVNIIERKKKNVRSKSYQSAEKEEGDNS